MCCETRSELRSKLYKTLLCNPLFRRSAADWLGCQLALQSPLTPEKDRYFWLWGQLDQASEMILLMKEAYYAVLPALR